jgi:hypothetical protein
MVQDQPVFGLVTCTANAMNAAARGGHGFDAGASAAWDDARGRGVAM